MAFSLSIILLVSALLITSSSSQTSSNEYYCNYASQYDETASGGQKVFDALSAQRKFITNYRDEVHNMFQPLLPNVNDRTISSASIKSVIEVIRMKERYDHEATGSDSLVQELLSKVAEESCNWLKDSLMIDLDCTNINESQLKKLSAWQFRIDLFNTIIDTQSNVEGLLKIGTDGIRDRIALDYCAWINKRLLDSCMNTPSKPNPRYIFNNEFCTTNTPLIPSDCAQLCT